MHLNPYFLKFIKKYLIGQLKIFYIIFQEI